MCLNNKWKHWSAKRSALHELAIILIDVIHGTHSSHRNEWSRVHSNRAENDYVYGWTRVQLTAASSMDIYEHKAYRKTSAGSIYMSMKKIRHRARANPQLAPQTAKKRSRTLVLCRWSWWFWKTAPLISMRIASSTQDRTHIHSKVQNGRPFGNAKRKRRYNAGTKTF